MSDKTKGLRFIHNLVADDNMAATSQSLAQYRTFILKNIGMIIEAEEANGSPNNEQGNDICHDVNDSLPDFLDEFEGKIIISYNGGTDVTELWNNWKAGNYR